MKVSAINLENFFLLESNEKAGLKASSKVKILANSMLELDCDIYCLSEVGGEKSLSLFNENYLNNQYHVSLIPGNSDRGIEIGFLIKKKLPFKYEHITYKNEILNFQYPNDQEDIEYKMSRDIAELRVLKNDKVILDILLVHLKSAYDPEGLDFRGIKRREAEVELLLKVYKSRQEAVPETPILLVGDFNGNASKGNHSREFKQIYERTNLQDIAEYLDLPLTERITFCSFDKLKQPQFQQLDYIFLDKKFKKLIINKVHCVYRYKDKDGNLAPLPSIPYQKYEMPSDHFPILIDLDLSKNV